MKKEDTKKLKEKTQNKNKIKTLNRKIKSLQKIFFVIKTLFTVKQRERC